MKKTIKIGILTLLTITFSSGIVWGVKAIDGRGGYSQHSYDRTTSQNQNVEQQLPEIIHNPPLQIKSTEDFYINAKINNLGNGIPIIYYRFEGDNHYYKRAMRKSPTTGDFQFKILGAALTGSQLDYYIEVATGSRVLASLGSEETPISVAIIAPQSKTTILYFLMAAGAAILVVKFVSASNKKNKESLIKDKTKVTKTVNQAAPRKRKAQLSARSR